MDYGIVGPATGIWRIIVELIKKYNLTNKYTSALIRKKNDHSSNQ